jgi:hypothetical protein
MALVYEYQTFLVKCSMKTTIMGQLMEGESLGILMAIFHLKYSMKMDF